MSEENTITQNKDDEKPCEDAETTIPEKDKTLIIDREMIYIEKSKDKYEKVGRYGDIKDTGTNYCNL